MTKPTFEQISSLFSQRGGGSVPDEIAGSSEAREIWSDLEAIRRAARSLPIEVPSTVRIIEQEEIVLAAARASPIRSRPRFVWRIAWPTAAVACASVAAFVVAPRFFTSSGRVTSEGVAIAPSFTHPTPDPVLRPSRALETSAAVHTIGGEAHYDRLITQKSETTGARRETVHVREGTLVIDRAAVEEETELLMATDDVTIELISGAAQISVVSGRLQSIVLLSGRAELRRGPDTSVALGPGDTWRSGASSAPSSAPSAGPASAPLPTRPSGLRAHRKAEATFRDAWEKLREGKHRAAAERFAEITSGPLFEDALFWRAVALDRSRSYDEARVALRRFLREFPDSLRAPEAQVLLGFQLVQSGEPGAARIHFELALDAKGVSPTVRDAAERGLSELGRPQP